MTIDDPALPAVRELSGPAAADVLRPAVIAAGGTLHDATCVQVHYLPGRELVVRYDCDLSWGPRRGRDTLLAATTAHGPLPGTLAVTAETPSGTLHASVWRWPFDPVLTGLPLAVAPAAIAARLDPLTTGPVRVQVVAYHPTDRAVVRATDASGRSFYVKVLPPARVRAVAANHQALRAGGVPVPEVLAADETNGLLVLAAMPGSTLRDRIKSGHLSPVDPSGLSDLMDRVAQTSAPTPGGGPGRAPRTQDALGHTRLIATIAPAHRAALALLEQRFAAAMADVERRLGPSVHGDFHEAQLFVDAGGSVTGLIDLDDLGPGDPLDDPAVLLGHLEYRSIVLGDGAAGAALRQLITDLRAHFALRHNASALDLTIAAVLVGLASGPFRIQAPDWQRLTAVVLAAATSYAANVCPAAAAPSRRRG